MNYNEIIKAINYKGEYTNEVKAKIRSLLKKYHPDHYKKESETFKLINSIKKDLDNNKKLNYEKKKETVNDTKITNEILELYKKVDEIVLKRKKYEEEIKSLNKKHQQEYDDYINKGNDEVDYTNDIIKTQSKKQIYNILLIASFLLSVLFIFTKWYYLLIITLILFIYVVYEFIRIDLTLSEYLNKNNEKIINNESSVKNISSINKKVNDLYKKIWELDIEKNRLNTRINLLKAKIR